MPHPCLSFQMHRDLDTGEWYVDRIDADFQNIRNQTRFITPVPVRFAFSPEFLDVLRCHLPVRLGPGIVTIDKVASGDFDFGMNGMRIVAQRAFSGLQSVTIRVQEFVGHMSTILSQQTMATLRASLGLEQTATLEHTDVPLKSITR